MKDQAFEPNLIDAQISRLSTNNTRTFTKNPLTWDIAAPMNIILKA